MISGSDDYGVAWDGPRNGQFTETFLRVWDGGRFRGSYDRLAHEIAEGMEEQTSHLERLGSGATFAAERPLTI